jgi:glyoxylase-like metal-dependent hydrolase (beta-lactamase superfamily II)
MLLKVEILEDLYLVAGGSYHYTNPCNCNVYLIKGKDDFLTLVDSGAGIDDSVVKSVLNLGFDYKNIKMIINTHTHWDHIGGNKRIQELTGCKIAIHEGWISLFEREQWPHGLEFDIGRVDLKLKDNDKIDIGKCEIRVIHTPGHSPDSICLFTGYKGKRILFSGDTAQGWGQLGVMDVETDFKAYRKSLEKLVNLKIDVLLPGHGVFIVSDAYEHINFLLEKLSRKWHDVTPFPQRELGYILSKWLQNLHQ